MGCNIVIYHTHSQFMRCTHSLYIRCSYFTFIYQPCSLEPISFFLHFDLPIASLKPSSQCTYSLLPTHIVALSFSPHSLNAYTHSFIFLTFSLSHSLPLQSLSPYPLLSYPFLTHSFLPEYFLLQSFPPSVPFPNLVYLILLPLST